MTILVQQLSAEIEQLRSQLEMSKRHGEVLQQIGNALRLGAGSDLHTACVPEIVALRRDAERYRLRYETLREMLPPQFSSIVEASSGTVDRMASMDTMIDAIAADQAMTKEQP